MANRRPLGCLFDEVGPSPRLGLTRLGALRRLIKSKALTLIFALLLMAEVEQLYRVRFSKPPVQAKPYYEVKPVPLGRAAGPIGPPLMNN